MLYQQKCNKSVVILDHLSGFFLLICSGRCEKIHGFALFGLILLLQRKLVIIVIFVIIIVSFVENQCLVENV